jgi:hypothetical protein
VGSAAGRPKYLILQIFTVWKQGPALTVFKGKTDICISVYYYKVAGNVLTLAYCGSILIQHHLKYRSSVSDRGYHSFLIVFTVPFIFQKLIYTQGARGGAVG